MHYLLLYYLSSPGALVNLGTDAIITLNTCFQKDTEKLKINLIKLVINHTNTIKTRNRIEE
jgi:hypothetical protein